MRLRVATIFGSVDVLCGQRAVLRFNGTRIESSQKFKLLGSMCPCAGMWDAGVDRRIGAAWTALSFGFFSVQDRTHQGYWRRQTSDFCHGELPHCCSHCLKVSPVCQQENPYLKHTFDQPVGSPKYSGRRAAVCSESTLSSLGCVGSTLPLLHSFGDTFAIFL